MEKYLPGTPYDASSALVLEIESLDTDGQGFAFVFHPADSPFLRVELALPYMRHHGIRERLQVT